MQHHKLNRLLLAMFSLCCTSVFAAATPIKIDPKTPIQIQADSATFDQGKQEAVHMGNVILTQGTHELHSERLTIKKDQKGRLTVITAIGTPATFSGKRQNDPNPVYATAKTIYYYPDKQLLVLEGAATLEHQQDKFRGPVLRYQLDKQIINATKQSDERPVITIHPRA